MASDIQIATEILLKGGVGILPTDTIYGIVGSALSAEVTERIYDIKKRNSTKPFIVLIADIRSIQQFGVKITKELESELKQYWPGPYSILLPVTNSKFEYLHRGSGKIAFRLPNKPDLINLLNKTGPLVAPSANTEGAIPAKTIIEAQKYFGEKVDFYLDGGLVQGKPSTILSFDGNKVVIERE